MISRQKIYTDRFVAICIGLAIWTGFIVRLRQYFFNRSLWLDEAFIAVAIRDAPWANVCIPPLEYSHVVPPFFAAVSKLAISVWGPQDYVFRLVPLFFGCGALVLFYYVAKNVFTTHRWLILLSVTLFALSPDMVYYAVEFKPYALDVFVSINCLWVWTEWKKRPGCAGSWLWLVLTGMVSVWLSLPAVFLLLGLGSELVLTSFFKAYRTDRFRIACVGCLWGLSFAFMYFLLVRPATLHNPVLPWLKHFWGIEEKAFAPHTLPAFWIWLNREFMSQCTGNGGFLFPVVCWYFLFFGGCVWLWIHYLHLFTVFFVTFGTLIGAALAGAYPFHGRMLLFVKPLLIICAVAGVGFYMRFIMSMPMRGVYKKTAVAGFCLILFWSHLVKGIDQFEYAYQVQEIKPILKYLQHNIEPGDAVYIYYWTEPAFRFYAEEYGFDFSMFKLIQPMEQHPHFYNELEYGRHTRVQPKVRVATMGDHYLLGTRGAVHQMAQEVALMPACRLWCIVSHLSPNDRDRLFGMLSGQRTIIKRCDVPGANAVCFGPAAAGEAFVDESR